MTDAGAATHEALLDEARALLAREGAERFSLREVARRARVSPAAVYRHFANKEALLDAVCTIGFQHLGTHLLRALAEKTPRARLAASADGYLRFGLEHAEHYRVVFMSPVRAKNDGVSTSETFQFLVDRVRECMAARVVAKGDPMETATSIWAHVHGLVSLRLSGHLAIVGDDKEFARFYRRVTAQFIDGLNVNTVDKKRRTP